MHASPATDPPRSDVPLTAILERVIAELHDLVVASDKLQDLPGKVALSSTGVVVDFIEDAQSLDLLSQRLQAVVTFLHGLRDLIPRNVLVDPTPAIQLLTLSEVAARLGESTAGPAELPQKTDDFELF